jgi:hypothetical protein
MWKWNSSQPENGLEDAPTEQNVPADRERMQVGIFSLSAGIVHLARRTSAKQHQQSSTDIGPEEQSTNRLEREFRETITRKPGYA